MSHASHTAHISNNSIAMRREPQSRRLSRRNPRRFSTIFGLSVCMLAVILAICAAPTRWAHGVKSQPGGVEAGGRNGVLPVTGTDRRPEIIPSSYFPESVVQGNIPTECCGKKPAFSDPAYSSVFTGQVAITTNFATSGNGFVLEVIDLKNQSTAPINTGPPTYNPAIYHGPAATPWTLTRLGTIFGLTLDSQGNIYTTATTAYNTDLFPAGATGGEIYRIDSVTGAITVFQTLPNTGHVGLGNINYDCTHRNFYVTNPDNGLIYRLDTTGAILSTFDHGANLPTATPSSAAIPDIPTQPFTPRGRLAWGIQENNGRLYYAEWPRVAQNTEVWSVGLLPNGDFTGSARREISIPPLTGTNAMPVSDISFSPTGTMLLAERTMTDETTSNAHQSRALEYTLVSGTWTLLNPAKFKFNVGVASLQNSSAGGVDPDFGPNGRYWFMGDAIHFGNPDLIYGLEGVPATGGDITNSVLIALSGAADFHKYELGDVEIPCPDEVGQPRTCAIKSDEISCKKDGTGGYVFTFTVTNNTGKPVTNVLLTPPLNSNFSITPQNPPLPGGVLLNGQSVTLTVTITGGQPGQKVCFPVTLIAQDGPCCTVEVCVVLPDCCAVATNVSVKCNPNGSYSYVFSIVNTSANTIQHIYLYSPAGVTMTPNYFAVSLAPGATFQTPPITITGAHAGSFCFRLSLHTEGMKECCSGDQCVTLPDCKPYGAP